MWLSVPIMLLKRVLRSFSASPGGRAATPSNITLSAQVLYRASILTVCVSIIWEISRCRFGNLISWSAQGEGSVGDAAQMPHTHYASPFCTAASLEGSCLKRVENRHA